MGPRASKGLIGAFALLTAMAVLIAACSKSERGPKLGKRVIPLGQPVPKGGGHYKVGNPYQINGRWYRPKEVRSYDRVGVASWYGELFHGRHTANGEIYDMMALTAAHPTLPLPVYARVTNLANGRSLVVRVNDRGPYAHDRIIDMSQRSAQILGFERQGTARVRVTYLGKAPLSGDDSYERRYLANQRWSRQYAANKARKPRPRAVASVPARKPRPATVARTPHVQPRPMTVATVSRTLPAASDGLIFVQAGSFRSRESAYAVKQRLASLGSTYVFPAEVSGQIFYRVRLGPYQSRAAAAGTLDRVRAAGSPGARIVRN